MLQVHSANAHASADRRQCQYVFVEELDLQSIRSITKVLLVVLVAPHRR